MLNITLVVIIGLLLLFCAYQQWRHEQWANSVIERFSAAPEPVPGAASGLRLWEDPPSLRPLTREELLGECMPFELSRLPDRCQPTRRMDRVIHPRFESYGVEISVSPTVGVT